VVELVRRGHLEKLLRRLLVAVLVGRKVVVDHAVGRDGVDVRAAGRRVVARAVAEGELRPEVVEVDVELDVAAVVGGCVVGERRAVADRVDLLEPDVLPGRERQFDPVRDVVGGIDVLLRRRVAVPGLVDPVDADVFAAQRAGRGLVHGPAVADRHLGILARPWFRAVGAAEDASRRGAVGARKIVGADGEVTEDHRRVTGFGAGDVAELAAHPRQLEEAPCALQGVLRFGQLTRLEGGGQRVVGDRNGRGERALLLGRLGRRGSDTGERKHGKADPQGQDPHR
jgi:hypothetical protein